jgi:hypothetical protein
MPHFWTRNAGGEWGIQTLAGECRLAASAGGGVRLTPPAGWPEPPDICILPPDGSGLSPSWTLLTGREASLRVNGQMLALGIRALRDRDEILFAAQRCFFSTEELALIVPFPGLEHPVFCPRCKQKLAAGEPAVACPHCHAWHHQSETFSCWNYGPNCALCQVQATALDAGYAWTPESL